MRGSHELLDSSITFCGCGIPEKSLRWHNQVSYFLYTDLKGQMMKKVLLTSSFGLFSSAILAAPHWAYQVIRAPNSQRPN